MSKKGWGILAGAGCIVVILLIALLIGLGFWAMRGNVETSVVEPTATAMARVAPRQATAVPVPTSTPRSQQETKPLPEVQGRIGAIDSGLLAELYVELAPGVVTIQTASSTGGGTGSGFVLDYDGHIVTNNHVVEGAEELLVVFSDGYQMPAVVVGTDDDSDLAVVKVDALPEGVHPLTIGDSDEAQVGQWVIAIGGPFGLGSTMTVGIVSYQGRTIESGVTPFSIPQTIQTDAAINPGNSGGPLLNLRGEVIGVNAQIATGGTTRANAGVGFAIPANVVSKVAPVLIEEGVYSWPWLGVQGSSMNYFLAQANRVDTQFGAYIAAVVDGGPAAEAGLVGSQGTVQVDGADLPAGGDIVVGIDGIQVRSFDDLLVQVSSREPGDTVTLEILRDGDVEYVDVTLAPRPQEFE